MAVACVTECREVCAYRCVMGITAIALQVGEAKQTHVDVIELAEQRAPRSG